MFYTYIYLRYDGTPYYVGKGIGDRARDAYGHIVSVPPVERIIVQHFLSEADALTAERFLIEHYGRADLGTGSLRNLTDGGEGISGYRFTCESRRRMSDKRKGVPKSDMTKERVSAAMLGKPKSEQRRRRISAALRRRVYKTRPPISEETRQRMRAAKLGNNNAKLTNSAMGIV